MPVKALYKKEYGMKCVHFMKENSARGASCWIIDKIWPKGETNFPRCKQYLKDDDCRFDTLNERGGTIAPQKHYNFVDTKHFKSVVKSGMTLQEAAKASGVKVGYVNVVAKKNGIVLKKKGKLVIDDIRRLAAEGKSTSEIATELKCSIPNIYKRARTAGIKITKGNRWAKSVSARP
jgi:hypothetical protein